MNNNAELQKDVQEKIKREPLLNAVEFGIKDKDFPVTLTVSVGNYIKNLKMPMIQKSMAGIVYLQFKINGY